MQWLYLNGSLVRRDEATISVLDPAVIHGRALIETFRSHGGRVFRLAQHFERLCSGAPVLGLTIPLTLPALEAAVADVLARNEAPDARLRLTVSAGADPTVVLSADPVIDYAPDEWIVESKSLKLYLGSFRAHGGFHEQVTVEIARRLVEEIAPSWLRIGGYWYPRGGMPIDVFYQTGAPPEGLWIPDQGVAPYRGRG